VQALARAERNERRHQVSKVASHDPSCRRSEPDVYTATRGERTS
jgi:hypothetical protein